MPNRCVVWIVLVFVLSTASQAEAGQLSAQIENSLLKKLLGNWEISDSSLDPQGQWQPGQGASWHFYPILNGHAIQDDWVAPALSQAEPDSGRQYGTNIRIYNPKRNQWDMAWASIKGQKVDTFTAVEKAASIIMSGQFNEATARITFFNLKAHSFEWKLELKQANETWLEVYRLSAKRRVK